MRSLCLDRLPSLRTRFLRFIRTRDANLYRFVFQRLALPICVITPCCVITPVGQQPCRLPNIARMHRSPSVVAHLTCRMKQV